MPTVVNIEQLGQQEEQQLGEGTFQKRMGKKENYLFWSYRIQREGLIHHSAVLPGDNFTYPMVPPHFLTQ